MGGGGGGGGGVVGVRSNPLLAPTTFDTHILLALPYESGPLVSLLLRITAVQTTLVAAMRVRTSAKNAHKL